MSNRLPCGYCGGYGFVIGFDNDQHKCPRCNGYCDDPAFEAGVKAGCDQERARCAEVCAEVRRTALRQTTGDMAHANGIAVGAEYCERKIRGEKC